MFHPLPLHPRHCINPPRDQPGAPDLALVAAVAAAHLRIELHMLLPLPLP